MLTAQGDNGGENGGENMVAKTWRRRRSRDRPDRSAAPTPWKKCLDRARRYRRQYKIQQRVIKRRQVMLVRVVKEEREHQGRGMTTYLSLRRPAYSVLMPNTARGGAHPGHRDHQFWKIAPA